ncbi:globin [Prolixibacteraceae bacterium JC049]|jgi:hemoglobin|nr:globin [Prolixibacteraceae bacterium JC049]
MDNFIISQSAMGERPDVPFPVPEFYNIVGEEGIRQIISDHYDLLAESSIKHLFPQSEEGLNRAKKNSADFFVQICGGPAYFIKNRGRPMMLKRHAPIQISSEARIVWLECYQQVLSQLDVPQEILNSFWNYLDTFSKWMVNTK